MEDIKEPKTIDYASLPEEWQGFFDIYFNVEKRVRDMSKKQVTRLLLKIAAFPMESTKKFHDKTKVESDITNEEKEVFDMLVSLKTFYGHMAISAYVHKQPEEEKNV